MSLRFIYGRSGTGKTKFCFDQISNLIKEKEKVYIITPEQFSYAAEKSLMEICSGSAVLNAEVISFERIAYRIINEIGGINNTSISDTRKSNVNSKYY